MSECHVHAWVLEEDTLGNLYEYCLAPGCGADQDYEEEDA